MYEYIRGRLEALNPAEAIVETAGIGYKLQISLASYSELEKLISTDVKLYLHHHIREDEETLFGFYTTRERELFELLITVNGIGPGSARMILSYLTCDDLTSAIIGEDVNKIKSVKGIGIKTAQRVIIELKDKVIKGNTLTTNIISTTAINNPFRGEAATALTLLGFAKPNIEKALDKILADYPDISLEDIIKKSLKIL
jgi:Holliday junction DNA helicase RuvA